MIQLNKVVYGSIVHFRDEFLMNWSTSISKRLVEF